MKEFKNNESKFKLLLTSVHHEHIFISRFWEKCWQESRKISIKVFILYAVRQGTSCTTFTNFGNPETCNFHKGILKKKKLKKNKMLIISFPLSQIDNDSHQI